MTVSTPDCGADAGAGAEALEAQIGRRIGDYQLIRPIGAGATGQVFEVEHVAIRRRYAMKILAPDHATRPGAIRRLFSEARAISEISHPHIVVVTDLIEAGAFGGVNAVVMELLQGRSLAQQIQANGGLPPARFLPILAQVAEGLAAAHAARFVHRDLKPENIFLCDRPDHPDFVKLLDFGLVASVAESQGLATAEGVFVGTPAYASPEQASGKPVDHRTDIYSLGVILYELLCRRLPFEGRNFGEFVVKHLTQEPPPAPAEVLRTDLGRALDSVARRCLAKKPEHRFSTAAELGHLFWRLAAGQSLPFGSVWRRSNRRPWLAVPIGAALLASGGLLLHRPAREPALTGVAAGTAQPLAKRASPSPAPTVILDFVSEPPGAETRVVGDPRLLGQTPFRLTQPASSGPVVYEMRLPGHAPGRYRVVLSPGETRLTVGGPLRKLPGPPAPARRRGGGKHDRDGTLNPFAR